MKLKNFLTKTILGSKCLILHKKVIISRFYISLCQFLYYF